VPFVRRYRFIWLDDLHKAILERVNIVFNVFIKCSNDVQGCSERLSARALKPSKAEPRLVGLQQPTAWASVFSAMNHGSALSPQPSSLKPRLKAISKGELINVFNKCRYWFSSGFLVILQCKKNRIYYLVFNSIQVKILSSKPFTSKQYTSIVESSKNILTRQRGNRPTTRRYRSGILMLVPPLLHTIAQ
jgi:hypothetical protein